ncbi:putative choline dehydrogenase protein [Lasiodiplodia theobromae]|uniref:Cyclase atC n=1 Tax=Lasiodiplodia theobromae TaxID=45133 RepID=A0A5N5D028_9PEZI|nr:Cyclase atC [Lasiodiplodia theobromae]KAF9641030.1 putative choline dehydrogenase protein [Lasiodiplodia theobromae]
MVHSFSTSLLGKIITFAGVASAVAVTGSVDGKSYDYIIVGGGLSGLVAANRLSENSKVSVLVIEYGPLDRSNKTLVPYYATSTNTAGMFNISSAPEPFLANATFPLMAGSIVGGGSAVNGMVCGRASAADYDSWEQLGNQGWGWNGLLPYFKKGTTLGVPSAEEAEKLGYTWDPSYYGNGPLQVGYPDFQYPDMYTFFNGFEELGLTFQKDQGAGNNTGLVWAPSALDIKTMTRSSSLTAYYDPVSTRKNLNLLTEHKVNQVILASDLTAQGVKITSLADGSVSSVYAKKEVILAAGAIHTPQILQLSGIGPKSVLKAAGVKVKLDLAAVGSNFQDHPVAYSMWNLNQTFPNAGSLAANATFNAESLAAYVANKTGPYTRAQGNSVAFLSLSTITSSVTTLLADLAAQIPRTYLPAIYSDSALLKGFNAQRDILVKQLAQADVAAIEFPFSGAGFVPNAVQKPLSRGTVYLNASDPNGAPVVTHQAFSNPFDRAQIFAAMQFTRKFFASEALDGMAPAETAPGVSVDSQEAFFSVMTAAGLMSPTFAHPSGSCPMMPRKSGGCVGADLLVYGAKKLSVIDASIMPIIPSNHLQASVYAVAEKAADLIKARA